MADDIVLDAEVESLDAVPEEYRALYGEHGEKFRLRAKGVEYEDDVRGLRSALERERADRRKAKEEAKALADKFGDIDDDALEQFRTFQRSGGKGKAKDEEVEALLRQRDEKHAKDIAKANDSALGWRSKLESRLVDGEIPVAVVKAGGNEDTVEILRPHIRNSVRVFEEDGDLVVRVVNEKGEPRVGAKSAHMTIEELVMEMREHKTYGLAFPASGKSGGGAPNGRGGAVGSGRSAKRSEWTVAEQSEFISKHGMDEYLKLPT